MWPRLLLLILETDNRDVLSLYLNVERALFRPRPGTVCYDSLGIVNDADTFFGIALCIIADVEVSRDYAVSIQLAQD